jgi:DNA polymerase III subunit delta
MVALKAHEVDAALRRLDPTIKLFLVYGPDAGLANERARALAQGAVDDPSDPFSLVRIEGDLVASDPGRLMDETGTVGLFGGRRAVWLKPTSRNLAPAVEAALKEPLTDVRIVIEAGDLKPSSTLRGLCEKSPRALALPCYADDERSLGALIDQSMRGAGVALEPEGRGLLLTLLGSDRLVSRGEIDKLVLYAGDAGRLTAADVEALTADASAQAVDSALDQAFSGDARALEGALRRLWAEGEAPGAVLTAALRYGLALLQARLEVDAGRGVADVVTQWRGLSPRRRDLVGRQLTRWRSSELGDVLNRVQSAVLASRRLPEAAGALAARSLFEIATRGGRT